MNTKNIGAIVASAAVSSLLSVTPATALITVEPILTTPDPNLPFSDFPIGVNPPREIRVWGAPDISGQQNFFNAGTGLDITIIELFLFPDFDRLGDEKVIWGDVNGDGQIGVSDIFENIQVENDFILEISGFSLQAPRVTFTDGVIPLGTHFVAQTLTDPDVTDLGVGDNGPLEVGGRYDGVKVPEPSTILGLVSVLGFGVLFNKKSSQKT